MTIFDLSDEDVLAVLTPIAESMQVGWDDDNYEKFSEFFTEDMKKDVNSVDYKKQRNEIFPDLGKHKKIEFLAIHKNPSEIIVMWRLFCTNREVPALVTYYFNENSEKVKIVAANLAY